MHVVIEAGELDAALIVVDLAEDAGQRVDRVQHRTAIHAGMQVVARPVERYFQVEHAAQHVGDRRRLDVPTVGVGHEADVGGQFFAVGFEERDEVGAAGFLLALQQDGDTARQGSMDGVPRAERLDEGHHLTLVVHGPARDDALSILGIDDGRLERRAVPKLQRLGRLNIVVAVVEHVRPRGARCSGALCAPG